MSSLFSRRAVVMAIGASALAVARVSAAEEKRFSARGVIEAFAPDRKTVTIAHEKIEGLMPAMTMTFDVRAPTQLAGFVVGDKVAFDFTLVDGKMIIDRIARA